MDITPFFFLLVESPNHFYAIGKGVDPFSFIVKSRIDPGQNVRFRYPFSDKIQDHLILCRADIESGVTLSFQIVLFNFVTVLLLRSEIDIIYPSIIRLFILYIFIAFIIFDRSLTHF